MAFVPDYRAYAPRTAADGAVIDAGLRGYMLRVYNWMTSGLLLTGIVAYGIANTSLINLFYQQVQTARGYGYAPTLLGYAARLYGIDESADHCISVRWLFEDVGAGEKRFDACLTLIDIERKPAHSHCVRDDETVCHRLDDPLEPGS